MIPRFAKMAANLDAHPRIRRGGRSCREVFLFVLRKNAEIDRSGRLPPDYLDPAYIADQLMMTESEAIDGLARAVRVGLLAYESEGGGISICGWDDEWAKAPLDEAERKRRQRERKESQDLATGDLFAASHVTKSHDANVTESDCPDSHASDQIRVEEIRSEESSSADRGETAAPPSPAVKRSRKANATAMPADWSPNAAASLKARELGLDLAAEAERFRDYHASKGSRFADWDAALRTWLGNAIRFAPRSGSKRNNPTETALEGLRDAQERERLGVKSPIDLFDAPHAAERVS